jgi:arylsulfatase A-like enzyme
MDVTVSMHRLYRAPPVGFPPPLGRAPRDGRHYQEICRNYAAMIENIDTWTGRLLDAIAARGENDRTLVIFCSDHGELLGDFGLWEKQRPYENSVRVPLIISGPGVRANRTDDALVSLIDVGATILDYAGVPQAPGMTSCSLRPLLAQEAGEYRKVVRSGLGPWRMVRDERYKLIVGYRPQMTNRDLMAGGASRPASDKSPVLLFDLKEDPDELHDIAAQCPEHVRRLTEIVWPKHDIIWPTLMTSRHTPLP